MASSSGFFDILNPWNWSSKRKLSGTDDSFADALKQYPELWKEFFLGSKILCCPVSGSLRDDISKEQLMSHILIPQRSSGEYKTVRGENVSFSGNELLCGAGFTERREVKVLSICQIADVNGKVATVFRINRPFIGGVVAPDDSDEVSLQFMFKYVAVLRSFPEVESSFILLDDYIKEINFVGSKSTDGFSRIQPSLAASLQLQWQRATNKLCKVNALIVALGTGPDATKRLIGQIVESYLMHAVSATVYPWVCMHRDEQDKEIFEFMESLQYHTQSDLGISPEFQCCQAEAIEELNTLQAAETPVDKLLILKKIVRHIRARINKNVQRKFLNEDIELATDDIVLVIIWVLLQLFVTQGQACNFPSELSFASNYHFNTSSKSELGFTLCHFLVAMDWFKVRAEAYKVERNKNLEFKKYDNLLASDGLTQRLEILKAGQSYIHQEKGEYKSNSIEKINIETIEKIEEALILNTNIKVHRDSGDISSSSAESTGINFPLVNSSVQIGSKDIPPSSPDDLTVESSFFDSILNSFSREGSPRKTPGLDEEEGFNEQNVEDDIEQILRDGLADESLELDFIEDVEEGGTEEKINNIGSIEGEKIEFLEGVCAVGTNEIRDWILGQKKYISTGTKSSPPPIQYSSFSSSSSSPCSSSSSSSFFSSAPPFSSTPDEYILSQKPVTLIREGVEDNDESKSLDKSVSSPIFIPKGPRVDGTSSELGKRIFLIGRDEGNFSNGIPGRVTIISEATNKPGGVISVTGAKGYFAAVNVDARIFTWGAPEFGRLGRGPLAELDSFAPVLEPSIVIGGGLEDVKVKQVACGKSHMIAVTDKGELFSWGDNRCAQLGLSPPATPTPPSFTPSTSSPRPSTPSSSIDKNQFSSPVSVNGNTQLSPQITAPPMLPGPIITELSAVMSCGPTPIEAMQHVKVKAVACGAQHSMCLSTEGLVYSWGRVANGRIGQYSDKMSLPDYAVGRPALVRCSWNCKSFPPLPSIWTNITGTSIEPRFDNYFSSSIDNTKDPGVLKEKLVYGVKGDSSRGVVVFSTPFKNKDDSKKGQTSISPPLKAKDDLMREQTIRSVSPLESTPFSLPYFHDKVVCIAAGFAHSLAVTARGTVFSWGCGTNGRLGHGSHCDEYIPRQIQVLTMSGVTITSLAAGVAHSLFLSDTGLVFGCGLDSCGQVGAFTYENDLSHDSDGKVLKPLKEASNKFDRHSILCPQPVDFPIQSPAAITSEVENVEGLNHCSCSSTSGDSVATAPTEGPDLGYDSINNHGVENTCIKDELNEIENNDLRISQIIRTHTISSISCGDFHSAAISHCQRLYTWGSTAQDMNMGANVSSISVMHSCQREKRDITPILGGSPKAVGCAGTFTLVTV